MTCDKHKHRHGQCCGAHSARQLDSSCCAPDRPGQGAQRGVSETGHAVQPLAEGRQLCTGPPRTGTGGTERGLGDRAHTAAAGRWPAARTGPPSSSAVWQGWRAVAVVRVSVWGEKEGWCQWERRRHLARYVLVGCYRYSGKAHGLSAVRRVCLLERKPGSLESRNGDGPWGHL